MLIDNKCRNFFADTNSSFLESKALVLQEMFSYAVSLRKPHSLHLEGEHFCAGFLLLDQNVISTARCLYKISEIECPLYDDVFAVTGAVEFGLGIRHNIKYLEVHENYNKNGNFENDIALITVSYFLICFKNIFKFKEQIPK